MPSGDRPLRRPARGYLIQDKHAEYLFTVKANQPNLEATIDRLGPEAFSPCAHRD
jgi:hypothetical protein